MEVCGRQRAHTDHIDTQYFKSLLSDVANGRAEGEQKKNMLAFNKLYKSCQLLKPNDLNFFCMEDQQLFSPPAPIKCSKCSSCDSMFGGVLTLQRESQ